MLHLCVYVYIVVHFVVDKIDKLGIYYMRFILFPNFDFITIIIF